MARSMESTSTPISRGGYVYRHNDEQDRADFAGHTTGELAELEAEHGFDFGAHPAMNRGGRPTLDPTGEPTVRVMIQLTRAQVAVVDHHAAQREVSRAEVVRELVDQAWPHVSATASSRPDAMLGGWEPVVSERVAVFRDTHVSTHTGTTQTWRICPVEHATEQRRPGWAVGDGSVQTDGWGTGQVVAQLDDIMWVVRLDQ